MFQPLKLLGVFVALLFATAIARADIASPPPSGGFFAVTDAYIWAEGSVPSHLTHQPLKPYRIWAENTFGVSMDFAPIPKDNTLCSRKDEMPCTLTVSVISKSLLHPIWKQELRGDGEISSKAENCYS